MPSLVMPRDYRRGTASGRIQCSSRRVYYNTVFKYDSMVFRMLEPAALVNIGTSVTGVDWVEVSPVTDTNPVSSRGLNS